MAAGFSPLSKEIAGSMAWLRRPLASCRAPGGRPCRTHGALAGAHLLTALLGVSACTTAAATTYHVRPDGGDADQCTGKSPAAYPGSGMARDCAWKHPFIALPPLRTPRIAGGDTLLVQRGDYDIGFGAPGAQACRDISTRDCMMPAIPNGPSPARPTRILGQGYATGCPSAPVLWATGGVRAILRLQGSSNVEIACLELTDRSSCIKSHNHAAAPDAKARAVRCQDQTPPFGPWGESGILAYDSGNVLLRDLDIHGFAAHGVRAGRLSDWTIHRVRLHANGWAGWDGNVDQDGRGSSNSGYLRFIGGEISWNGCGERYPGREIFGCWAQQQGGYGDGLGTAKTGGDWLFEDMHVHHNTSDGVDLLYLDGSGSATVRRLRASANAGNQLKTAGPVTIEDSVLVGTCAFFTTHADSHLIDADHCRAMGNTLSVTLIGDSLATIRNNTLTGQGDCQLVTVGGSRGARVRVQNNAFIGGTDWRATSRGKNELSCGHYAHNSDAAVEFKSNLFWNLKRGQCPQGSVCGSGPRVGKAATGKWGAPPRHR